MPQVAHKEALSVVQQALACIEEEGVSLQRVRAQEEGGGGAGSVCQAVHAHLLQLLRQALIGHPPTANATAAPAQQDIAEIARPQRGPSDGQVAHPTIAPTGQPPPPLHLRARALHAAAVLSSSSTALALTLQSELSPLLLQLLQQQAQGGTREPALWAEVTQVCPRMHVFFIIQIGISGY